MVSVHIREIDFYDFLHFHIWSSRAKIDHFYGYDIWRSNIING